MACLEDPPLSFNRKMADTSPKKKVAAKPKKPAAHPKYSEMVGKAIAALKERGGSSRQLAWTISVYDADADLREDTYTNIYKF
jgi:hypothetical protein